MKLLLLVALACGAGLALASRLPSDAELRTEPAAAGGQAASTAEAAPVFVCEAFTAKQCAEQKHCELCTRLDGLELCFSQKVAAKLPPYIFACKAPDASAELAAPEAGEEGEGAPAPAPGPKGHDCWRLTPEQCKNFKDSCALCTSPMKPAKCYSPKAARKLPAIVFKCDIPAEAAE